jgi:hypothetical protein
MEVLEYSTGSEWLNPRLQTLVVFEADGVIDNLASTDKSKEIWMQEQPDIMK